MPHASFLATSALVLSVASAFQLPNFEPFFAALPLSLSDYIPSAASNQTEQQHDLLKRQFSNTCPTNFNSCQNLGAAGLCCAPNAVCSPDAAGHVACCPSGAACSGTIAGVITAGTLNSDGGVVGAATTGSGAATSGLAGASATSTTAFQAASTTSDNGLVVASTTTATTGEDSASSTGFIINGGSTVATPGAGRRAAEMPLFARAIVQYLPV